MFTASNLKIIFPTTSTTILTQWVEPLNKTIQRYQIDTRLRASAFIAQTGHESGELTAITENLNYSADALLRVFGKYFSADQAKLYARNPAKIANRVYANRMGNGPESSGDGWKFRGRGLIQVTGKNNYSALAKSLNMTIDETIAYLETKEGAAMSAGWFWSTNGLNVLADANRFTDLTKRINGGTNGIAHRKALWNRALKVIG